MPRSPGNQADILMSVVDRLVDSIEEATPSTVIVSMQPEPPQNVSKNLFLIVSPMEGTFDVDAFEGGAENVCIEQTGVVVTIYSAYKGRRGEEANDMVDPRRGMLEWKRRVISALAGYDASAGRDLPLTSLMEPLQSGRPEEAMDGRHASLMITFSLDIHWELTD